mgnify:CR=1 FL=1
MKFIKCISICLVIFQTAFAQDNTYKLWYNTPAQVWTEALPLGNGRLGAMVFGNPAVEQIQLKSSGVGFCRQVRRS